MGAAAVPATCCGKSASSSATSGSNSKRSADITLPVNADSNNPTAAARASSALEAFLKRWLIAINKELTAEQIESEFESFINDLKWQLIKNVIIKDNQINVTDREAKAFATQMARAQYNQYGIFDIPEEQLESFSKRILEKPEENERVFKRLYESKVIKVVKEKVSLLETEVSQEEFNEMIK